MGVVLAGGRATRMGGGDKGLLPLGGRPLLAHVIGRLGPQVAAVVLNANGDPARLAGFGLPVVADVLPGRPGPLAGVLTGLDYAAQAGFRGIVTAAADTPFFPGDLVARLTAAGGPRGLSIAATETPEGELKRHPAFGLWPVALREDLRDWLASGGRKVTAWTDRHGAPAALYPAGQPDPFFNINRPEDLAAAEALL